MDTFPQEEGERLMGVRKPENRVSLDLPGSCISCETLRGLFGYSCLKVGTGNSRDADFGYAGVTFSTIHLLELPQ